MNYEEYRSTSKWTKGFWDPAIAPLSDVSELRKINQLDPKQLFNNYMTDPSQTYEFDFFEHDNKIINPYWKDKTVNYTLNAHGYRGPSFKSDAKLKIVTIGCSHVFGLGIDDNSTWAEQLKKIISAQFKTDNVEVFNLGTPGASSDLNTVQLYQLIDVIQPSIVLWMPPEWRRYDIGSKSLDLLSLDSFFELHENEIEHGVHNIQPNQNFEKKFIKNVSTYVRMGSLDTQTRYQNFCKNFTIVRDLCEYYNIVFHSFTNFNQVRSLHNHLIGLHTTKLPIRDTVFFLRFAQSHDYLSIKSLHNDDLSHEEAALDYYITKTQKNIIGYDSRILMRSILQIRKDIHSGLYDEYLDGTNSDPMHSKLLARDNSHCGHFFNTILAVLSYDIVKEDIAKLLNT